MDNPVENAPERESVERVTVKIVERAEALLDSGELLSAGELDKIAGVLKDAAAILGVRSLLDDEEQRAQIAVLLAKADGGKRRDDVLRIEFAPGVDELAN